MTKPIARRSGENHPKAKLSDDDVRLMRELRQKHGLPYSAIAEKFECSLWMARDIVTYTTRVVT